MGKEKLIENVLKHITLNPDEQERFLSFFQPLKIKRKQLYLHRGEICRHSTFVLSGCLRGYTIDANGLEHILNFAPADWWIADMYSLLSQQPGYLNIDALEDSLVLQLSKANQEIIYAEMPQFERYFRIITEKSLVGFHQRTLDSLSLPAQERYLKFCKQYPSLVNQIPQKHIASYIGVTPEFFSKMRSDLLRQE